MRTLQTEKRMTDKSGWKRLRDSILRGTIIGVVCGCVTGPTVFVWLLVDSFLEPQAAMGSLIAFGPIMVGMLATALGVCLGPFYSRHVLEMGRELTIGV
jgi:Mg/Co/Ni transporter MgtE